MLTRKHRLPVRAKATRPSSHKSRTFRLMLHRSNLPLSRFGFVIGKKIDKRAVVRNRTKRVMRSCIEEMLPKIENGYDMLFILQKNAVGQKREAFYSEIENLFKELKLIK